MWSTCKVVHHVHAVGALVHQAAQARPLPARFVGVWGIEKRRTILRKGLANMAQYMTEKEILTLVPWVGSRALRLLSLLRPAHGIFR